MPDLTKTLDVLVIGGGNAALCAKLYRGGNTWHTRNMRCAHESATDTLMGPHPEDEFWTDLLRVIEATPTRPWPNS